MSKMRRFPILTSILVFLLAPATRAAVFFTDDFSNGSTTNQLSLPGGTSTASSTSYDFASSKNSTVSTIAPHLLQGQLSQGTTSGYWEAQALFATGANAVGLNAPGDYVELAIVFTNSGGVLLNPSATGSELWIGLYNSGSSSSITNFPVAGNLANAGLTTTASSPYATGNCQLWSGYAWRVFNGAASRIITRPVQNGAGTASSNQELLGSGVSGGTFNNPSGTTLLTGPSASYTLNTTDAYTLATRITLDPDGTGSLVISNGLFVGAGTGGSLIFSNVTTTSTILATAFDGLAFGVFNKSVSQNARMDVSSITVTGQSSAPVAPTITTQPSSVAVATGGACAFIVEAVGNNLSYQWHRGGTNLVNGGNISGATSPMLVVSSASAADVLSGANGYYVTVTGSGNLSVDSTTAALALRTPTSLIYSGSGAWDLNTSPSWQDGVGNTGLYFNFGDPVTFNDVGGGGIVNLNGPFLSAASVTVSHTSGFYTFQGSGSFAGPGRLLYNGSAQLTINNVNIHTGGTIISNATANLRLQNMSGLGTGPLAFAKAGGKLEVLSTGSASSGIQPDVVVQDDFTIQFDGTGTFAGVFLGNLSGTTGKTLTLDQPDTTTTNRYRVYGSSTVYDGNLVLNGANVSPALYGGTVLAPYNANGSQTYNGVISGNGGLVQRANGMTILNGANTYSGGTVPTTGTIALGVDTIGSVTSGPIGTGPLFIAPEVGSGNGSGTVLAWGGARTIANPIQYPSGTNNQTLVVGGTNNLTFSGAVTLNGNDNQGTAVNRIFQVNNTGLTTISGVISDGGAGYGFTKSGTGILALSNTETYTGTTIVNAGTLLVNGQIGSGAVTVTNATIGGSGTIGGAVTVQNRGAVAPGNQGVGTLTLNSSLTLLGGTTNFIEVNKQAGTRDRVIATSIAYNGTLYATNLAGTLSAGDTFAIYTGTGSGNFTNISGSPGAGLNWDFNPTSGVLSVVAGMATNPTNITVSVSGNNLTLTWPTDHLGWTLESNSVSLTAAGSWFAVPNSTTTTNVTINFDASKTNVFYRLKL